MLIQNMIHWSFSCLELFGVFVGIFFRFCIGICLCSNCEGCCTCVDVDKVATSSYVEISELSSFGVGSYRVKWTGLLVARRENSPRLCSWLIMTALFFQNRGSSMRNRERDAMKPCIHAHRVFFFWC